MNRSGKILLFGGMALAGFGMLYGLHYAVFIEHQTLDKMGGALAGGFIQTAQGRMPEARAAIDAYGRTKYNYVRQVDVHSHWIGLAMLMIVLGAVFEKVAFSEPLRRGIALALLAGSILFPFGVMVQTATHGGRFASGLAIGGSALVTLGLAACAVGFARQSS
jgi:hypothetical protein